MTSCSELEIKFLKKLHRKHYYRYNTEIGCYKLLKLVQATKFCEGLKLCPKSTLFPPQPGVHRQMCYLLRHLEKSLL